MGIMVYALFWVMQDLYHQPYLSYVPDDAELIGSLQKQKNAESMHRPGNVHNIC